jgi:hypothetical protein
MDCVIQMQGEGVDPVAACEDDRSKVVIVDANGVEQELICDDPNGYRLVGPTTIEILGEACARLQGNEELTVKASFPCEVFIE